MVVDPLGLWILVPVHGAREGGTRLMTKQDLQDELLLDAWRDQVEQALREQGVGRGIGQESAGAYENFLDTLFFYYGESMRAVEKGTEGG